MKLKRINIDGPTPLYIKVKKNLKEMIENGIYKLNMKLPTEEEFIKKFDVSRPTVRRAITELVNEGYLTRSRGKGTFVIWTKINYGIIGGLYSYNKKMVQQGIRFNSKVIKKGIREASAKVARNLGLKNDFNIFVITRVRYLENKPVLITTSHIPSIKVPNINSDKVDYNSIHFLLTKKYGYTIAKGVRTFEVGVASKEETKLLDIIENSPVLNVESITYLDTGEAIEYVEATVRKEYSRFSVELV